MNDWVGLALETSTAWGSVTIGRGPRLIETRRFSAPRAHAVELLATIAALCRDHGVEPGAVDRVFLSGGPGSFTGLRLGVTVARMLALTRGTCVVRVPTMALVAQNAFESPEPVPWRVVVVLDAKQSRVYAGVFGLEGKVVTAIDGPMVVEPGELLALQPPGTAVLGEGVTYHRQAVGGSKLRVLPEELWMPRSDVLYQLGLEERGPGTSLPRHEVVPLYVRPPEAEEKWKARLCP